MLNALEPGEILEISPYLEYVPQWVSRELTCMAEDFKGATLIHVNSTASGGGVAEILRRLVPLQRGLGIDAHWLVMQGDEAFFKTTKKMHNALQGASETISGAEWNHYLEVNRQNLVEHGKILSAADFVIIHDPQPAAMMALIAEIRGKWAWRCHIDLSRPFRPVWRRLQEYVRHYQLSIFSLSAFSRRLPHQQVIIPPAIDPLTEKNCPLEEREVTRICKRLDVPLDIPLFVQVSRFDRFKDPVGVIQAFKALRRHKEAVLVLAGGSADDDPEGTEVLREAQEVAGDDPDIKILELPPDAHRDINALQRAATVVIQKSLMEGFGLVVTEALWKGKPVIAGAVGGITLQVRDNYTGYLVRTVEGCAFRMRHLLRWPLLRVELGANGIDLVRGNYLITRQLRDHLMVLAVLSGRAVEPLSEV